MEKMLNLKESLIIPQGMPKSLRGRKEPYLLHSLMNFLCPVLLGGESGWTVMGVGRERKGEDGGEEGCPDLKSHGALG